MATIVHASRVKEIIRGAPTYQDHLVDWAFPAPPFSDHPSRIVLEDGREFLAREGFLKYFSVEIGTWIIHWPGGLITARSEEGMVRDFRPGRPGLYETDLIPLGYRPIEYPKGVKKK